MFTNHHQFSYFFQFFGVFGMGEFKLAYSSAYYRYAFSPLLVGLPISLGTP